MLKKAKPGELQPLTEVSTQQAREYIGRFTEGAENKWDVSKEGDERTWELRITPELVILYADGVEDYNSWYEAWGRYGGPQGKSPFGSAIAPPLLLSKCSGVMFDLNHPFPVGAVHTYHNSQIIEPVPIGTLVRFHCEVTDEFVKRHRRYVRHEIRVEDTSTGRLIFKETREYLCQYNKA